jgi:hypothetical protein
VQRQTFWRETLGREKMKKIVMLNFLGLFFFLTISGAQAELVYNNGLPNGPNGNEMTYWIQAEDFPLLLPKQ